MSELTVVVCVAFDHRADTEGLKRFKQCICHCPFVDVAMDVSGTYDMIVHGRIASVTDYNEQLDRISEQIARYVSRIEANFVARKIERITPATTFIWVPCNDGHKKINVGAIDKVIAEGDYMRLYVGNWQCLVHTTFCALKAQLDNRFIQLHRSAVVRVDFIERLVHRERRWIARLNDGSQQIVAKSCVSHVLGLMSADSSNVRPTLSIVSQIEEKPTQPNEARVLKVT